MPFTPPREQRTDEIQDGVHFRPGETPPDLWRLATFDIAEGASPGDAAYALDRLWSLLADLREGRVPELEPAPDEPPAPVPTGSLTPLLGYGARLFEPRAGGPPLVPRRLRPPQLGAPLLAGSERPFARLHWDADADVDAGQRDLAIQLTADTELALARAVLEINQRICNEQLALVPRRVFEGFHRDDRRSWIGFHDGVSNLSAQDRRDAIMHATDFDAPWMSEGTFLAFLKIEVDLVLWRTLPRPVQEAVVGRAKLSGAPLTAIDRDDGGRITVTADAGCPVRPLGPLPGEDPRRCVDPPIASDPGLAATHISRSNLLRGEARIDANNRLYRQGYEFLDLDPGGRMSAGLNFVAFVRRLDAVRFILSRSRWLGDANFGGGDVDIPDPELMRLIAGGFYAVPRRPRAQETFPGASLFAAPGA